MQMTQANNFEFGLMEIYKGVLFMGLSQHSFLGHTK